MCQDAFGNPIPHEPGKIIEAPVWIRVKPDWYEKTLLVVCILLLIGLGSVMLVGSVPSRESNRQAEMTRIIVCEMVRDRQPIEYERFQGLGYCP